MNVIPQFRPDPVHVVVEGEPLCEYDTHVAEFDLDIGVLTTDYTECVYPWVIDITKISRGVISAPTCRELRVLSDDKEILRIIRCYPLELNRANNYAKFKVWSGSTFIINGKVYPA